ncbi:hypothetical protein SRHO_G00151050 [Serrasalmus rhombeus]
MPGWVKPLRHQLMEKSDRSAESYTDPPISPGRAAQVFSPSESSCHEPGDDRKLGTLPKETHYRTTETQRQMAPPEPQFLPSTTPDTEENNAATQTTSRGRVG